MDIKKEITIESVTLAKPSLREEEKEAFISTPAGQSIAIIQQALQQGSIGYESWAKRKMKLNNRSELRVSQSNNKDEAHLTYKTKNNSIEVTLPIDKQLNIAAQKIFLFLINEACKRCISKGELYEGTFTFKTSDLVDIKMYRDIRSAKRALVGARKNLKTLSVGQTEKRGKEVRSFTEGTLFPTISLNKNGECFIRLNPDIDWKIITTYWTILPSYFYSLSNKAQSLLWYILITARQKHIKSIDIQTDSRAKKTYPFVCRLRALQTAIPLPSENTKDKNGKPCLIKKANEKIKSPLKDMIAEILRAHKTTYKNKDIWLELKENEASNIKAWLEKSFLKVSISGEFLKNLLDIAMSKEKKMESSRKKKEQREEEAKIRSLTKTIKEAASTSEG